MYKYLLILLTVVAITACQRFEKPEDQTGLDKDSHSYSNVGYPDSRMKQMALQIKEVEDVVIEYTGRRIVVYVIPNGEVHRDQYKELEREVRKKVEQVTPQTPFQVEVVDPHTLFNEDGSI
ncbi:hypothetical protein IC620_07670 [Hazenella sp. IB182357]|uniref:Uncharacterized protein n=1 Tax=Polycladospora coralii TaxID=2771432 RepID=A0A926RX67_9BACL|nr:hypothetical protein [Polycladospora coralii]MBD1372241.1 hypothetical protein [Polycladospora coralii]MBS7530740.1 hypothetical protein [Polycladospora coralii]